VRRGELTESRIDRSVLRVLHAKQQLGLHRNALVDIERIPHVVGAPAHQQVAAEAAQRSITAVRNEAGVLPLRARRVLSIVYTDDFDPTTGRSFQRELATGVSELIPVSITGAVDPARLASIVAMADSVDAVLFSPFIRVVAGKAGIGIAPHVAAA